MSSLLTLRHRSGCIISISSLITGAHVSHLESTHEGELNRLIGVMVDVLLVFHC